MLGDPTRRGKAAQMRALWESQPNNPAYFADYSLYHFDEHGTLPKDFLKIAKRIDPKNAWFTCLAASIEARDSCSIKGEHAKSPIQRKELQSTDDVRRGQIIGQYHIIDPAAATRAMALWRSSLEQPHYTSYQKELWTQRLAHMPERGDYLSLIRPLCFLLEAPHASAHLRHIGQLLAAELQQCDTTRPEGAQLFLDVERHLQKSIKAPTESFEGALRKRAQFRQITQQIVVVSKPAALDPALIDQWTKRYESFLAYDLKIKENQGHHEQQRALFIDQGSSLTQFYTLLSREPGSPNITSAMLAPMRYVEQCFLLRINTWYMLGILMILFLSLFAYRLRHANLICQLGKNIHEIIPLRRRLLFLFCGTILPFFYYFFLYTCTPLAGKFHSMEMSGHQFESAMVFPTAPYVILFLLILTLPVILSRQLYKPYQQALSAPPESSIFPILCLLLCGIGWHLFTLSIVVAYACAAPLLLWLLWITGRSLFSQNPLIACIRQGQSRFLQQSMALAILLLSFTAMGFHRAEISWMKHDVIVSYPQDTHDLSLYESSTAKIIDQATQLLFKAQ